VIVTGRSKGAAIDRPVTPVGDVVGPTVDGAASGAIQFRSSRVPVDRIQVACRQSANEGVVPVRVQRLEVDPTCAIVELGDEPLRRSKPPS
jgi:hypothetical protein